MHTLVDPGVREISYDDAPSAAKAEAEALFDRLTKAGWRVANVKRASGEPDEFVNRFCEIENEALLVRPVVAG